MFFVASRTAHAWLAFVVVATATINIQAQTHSNLPNLEALNSIYTKLVDIEPLDEDLRDGVYELKFSFIVRVTDIAPDGSKFISDHDVGKYLWFNFGLPFDQDQVDTRSHVHTKKNINMLHQGSPVTLSSFDELKNNPHLEMLFGGVFPVWPRNTKRTFEVLSLFEVVSKNYPPFPDTVHCSHMGPVGNEGTWAGHLRKVYSEGSAAYAELYSHDSTAYRRGVHNQPTFTFERTCYGAKRDGFGRVVVAKGENRPSIVQKFKFKIETTAIFIRPDTPAAPVIAANKPQYPSTTKQNRFGIPVTAKNSGGMPPFGNPNAVTPVTPPAVIASATQRRTAPSNKPVRRPTTTTVVAALPPPPALSPQTVVLTTNKGVSGDESEPNSSKVQLPLISQVQNIEDLQRAVVDVFSRDRIEIVVKKSVKSESTKRVAFEYLIKNKSNYKAGSVKTIQITVTNGDCKKASNEKLCMVVNPINGSIHFLPSVVSS